MAAPYRVLSGAANRTSAATANSAAAVGSIMVAPLARYAVHEGKRERDGNDDEDPEKKASKFIHYRFHARLHYFFRW
jgi:hypothetical protein